MGFFSKDCKGCGHPLLSLPACTPLTAWMADVAVVFPDGVDCGEYDGFGGIIATAEEREQEMATEPTIQNPCIAWHLDCFELAGSPRKFDATDASPFSDDQGWFFTRGVDHYIVSPLVADEDARIARAEGRMGRREKTPQQIGSSRSATGWSSRTLRSATGQSQASGQSARGFRSSGTPVLPTDSPFPPSA